MLRPTITFDSLKKRQLIKTSFESKLKFLETVADRPLLVYKGRNKFTKLVTNGNPTSFLKLNDYNKFLLDDVISICNNFESLLMYNFSFKNKSASSPKILILNPNVEIYLDVEYVNPALVKAGINTSVRYTYTAIVYHDYVDKLQYLIMASKHA